MNPVFPGMRAPIYPPAAVVKTGQPTLCASIKTLGEPSLLEVRINISLIFKNCCVFLAVPINLILSLHPNFPLKF